MYLLTTTHCFTKSDTKPRSGKEHISGYSSKVDAVHSRLKEHLIVLAFCLTGYVFEIRSPYFKIQEIHIYMCYSFVFLPATAVDNEHFFQVRHPLGVEYKVKI
jgi:hypothetical protein